MKNVVNAYDSFLNVSIPCREQLTTPTAMTYDESETRSLDLLAPPTPVSTVLRGDDAYERIRRDLLSCKLMPGSTVTESQLMAAYDIGNMKASCVRCRDRVTGSPRSR